MGQCGILFTQHHKTARSIAGEINRAATLIEGKSFRMKDQIEP
jgi:hypothetical protein